MMICLLLILAVLTMLLGIGFKLQILLERYAHSEIGGTSILI